jgi:ketosteroid isomerase-like protein
VSANLDLVKSIYAAWAEGDFSSGDWAHPDIEFVMHDGLTPGRWTGVEEMAEVWAAMLRAWENLRAEPSEFRELDDGRVLVFLRNTGRGRVSGIDIREISAKSANVFTIRDGKVTSLILYWDRDRALADLGLAGGMESRGA